MNYATLKLRTSLITGLTLFALTNSSVVFSAGLFDNLLETVVDQAAKEVIDNINKNADSTQQKPPSPPANVSAKTTVAKPSNKRPSQKNNQWQTYKDWQVSVNTFQNSKGKWITNCSVYTGGDGASSIGVEIPWGNNGIPGTAPSVNYSEATQRHMQTELQGKQEVTWVVDTSKAIFKFPGETFAGHYDNGIPYAINRIQGHKADSDSLNLLRAFAKGSKVRLFDEYSGGDLHFASLSGFSASYRKASQWCGFSPDNVLKVAPIATSSAPTASTSLTFTRERPQKERNLREVFGDWQVTVKTVESGGGDLVTSCSISTGGDGTDSITMEAYWDDALPPEVPLEPVFSEATSRGVPTRLQQDDGVDWLVNSGNNRDLFRTADTYVGIDEEGIPYADNYIRGNKDIAFAFTQGDKVILRYGNFSEDLYTGSLVGFSDAYRKMAQWCGFPASDLER